MALKDWKKVTNGVKTIPPTTEWKNKSKYLTLSMHEIIYGGMYSPSKKGGWEILINYYNPSRKVHKRIMFNGADRKRFKIKSSALSFAKDYMRRH